MSVVVGRVVPGSSLILTSTRYHGRSRWGVGLDNFHATQPNGADSWETCTSISHRIFDKNASPLKEISSTFLSSYILTLAYACLVPSTLFQTSHRQNVRSPPPPRRSPPSLCLAQQPNTRALHCSTKTPPSNSHSHCRPLNNVRGIQ